MPQLPSRLQRSGLSFRVVAFALCLAGCVDTSQVDEDEGMGGNGPVAGDSGPVAGDNERGLVTDEGLSACAVPPMEGRVVLGYVPSWADMGALTESLDFNTLTHIALAFTNPTADDGTTHLPWVSEETVHALVKRAHENGVKVLASIGGAAESDKIRERLGESDVDAYVEELAGYLDKFDLDGVDVDIEGGLVDSSYGPFVEKLASRIRPNGKLITAAVGQWFQAGVTDQALHCFDFINEMSYDAAGGWSGPEEHAARSFVRSRAHYWTETRGYPSERVVIGLPFYGYCWGSACAQDGAQIPFRRIQELYPESIEGDWIREENLEINFNGTLSIAYKTEFAKDYGGVMVWDMSQDDSNETLFSALRDAL